MCTHVVCARADVVVTKLGIILSSFSSFFFLPRTSKPWAAKGPERSGGTQSEDLGPLVGSGRRSVCAMGK